MIVDHANLRSLYTGFSTAFAGGIGMAGDPQYGRIALTVPSSTRANEYGWLGQFPRIREWIGDRVVNNLETHGYTIRNRSFEGTIGVNREDIEDDNIGIYSPMFSEFGRSTATFGDELTWPFLQSGFATVCFDGQYFFDTDHPVYAPDGTITTYANTDGGNGAAWFLMDVSRVIKPVIYQNRKPFNLVRMDAETDERVFSAKEFRYGTDGRCNVGWGFPQLAWGSKQTLDAAHYELARSTLQGLKGDYGRPLGIRPNLLVVGAPLEGAGRRILQSQLVSGGESNPWAGTAELMVVPWLT